MDDIQEDGHCKVAPGLKRTMSLEVFTKCSLLRDRTLPHNARNTEGENVCYKTLTSLRLYTAEADVPTL